MVKTKRITLMKGFVKIFFCLFGNQHYAVKFASPFAEY